MAQCKSSTIVRSKATTTESVLLRMAVSLLGSKHLEDVLGRSLEHLGELRPRSAWAVLYRVAPRKYETLVEGKVRHRDLRHLADRACGAHAWLALCHVENPGPEAAVANARDSGRRALQWSAVPQPSDVGPSEPELVLGHWVDERSEPLTPVQLETAARMIAAAIGAARSYAYLLEQTCRDPLTGLLNRRGILEMLKRERARADRSALPLSVLFLDLDLFKEINDKHGHAAGDEILSATAAALARALRTSDAVGRLGGDEFLVVLPDTDLRTARSIGRRLVQAIGTKPLRTSVGSVGISLTWGASCVDETLTEAGLVERADRRMLAQKRSARDEAVKVVGASLSAGAAPPAGS